MSTNISIRKQFPILWISLSFVPQISQTVQNIEEIYLDEYHLSLKNNLHVFEIYFGNFNFMTELLHYNFEK